MPKISGKNTATNGVGSIGTVLRKRQQRNQRLERAEQARIGSTTGASSRPQSSRAIRSTTTDGRRGRREHGARGRAALRFGKPALDRERVRRHGALLVRRRGGAPVGDRGARAQKISRFVGAPSPRVAGGTRSISVGNLEEAREHARHRLLERDVPVRFGERNLGDPRLREALLQAAAESFGSTRRIATSPPGSSCTDIENSAPSCSRSAVRERLDRRARRRRNDHRVARQARRGRDLPHAGQHRLEKIPIARDQRALVAERGLLLAQPGGGAARVRREPAPSVAKFLHGRGDAATAATPVSGISRSCSAASTSASTEASWRRRRSLWASRRAACTPAGVGDVGEVQLPEVLDRAKRESSCSRGPRIRTLAIGMIMAPSSARAR